MQEETLLRFDEAARILGLKTSTLRAWRLAGRCPVVVVGSRSVRLPLSWIRRVIDDGLIPARRQR
jgi:hypothetical protein